MCSTARGKDVRLSRPRMDYFLVKGCAMAFCTDHTPPWLATLAHENPAAVATLERDWILAHREARML